MQSIITQTLVLEPLAAGHAEAMFEVLSDAALYRYLDHPRPASVEHLRTTYARLETRRSPDGSQLWLNWVVRPKGGPPIGYVQATVLPNRAAWVAYVLSSRHWGQGYATQATQAVIEHLAVAHQVQRFLATVETENRASIRLLERLAFRAATVQESEGHALSPTERLFVRP